MIANTHMRCRHRVGSCPCTRGLRQQLPSNLHPSLMPSSFCHANPTPAYCLRHMAGDVAKTLGWSGVGIAKGMEALGLDEVCLAPVVAALLCRDSPSPPCACTSLCVLATMFGYDTVGAVVKLYLMACLLKHSILQYSQFAPVQSCMLQAMCVVVLDFWAEVRLDRKPSKKP